MERDGEAVGEVAQAGLEMRFRKRDEAAARGFALELLGLDPPSGRPGDNGAGARKAQGQAYHPFLLAPTIYILRGKLPTGVQ